MAALAFPQGFLWGTATSPHQVEGNNDNCDWWDWEQVPGHIRNNDRSGLACDQWNRYQEDFDLAAAMHNNAHRLGVEWARIEPRPGEWSKEAIAHYRQVMLALRERGLEPLVTLHHFTSPRWLAARGGWENPEVVSFFERYVSRVVEELGDLVSMWCTINEPGAYTYMGWVTGAWLPQKKDLRLGLTVLRHMLLAHAAAYQVIHKANPKAMVGIAHAMVVFDPANPASALDRWAARIRDRFFNDTVLSAQLYGEIRLPLGLGAKVPEVADTYDYFGVNYYYRNRVAFDWRQPSQFFGRNLLPPDYEPGMPFWRMEIYPEGLYRLCLRLAPYGKPIYITENGLFDNTDAHRPAFILTHLAALHRAIRDGAPVKGYYHWSLIDNFEWAEGFWTRFGLVHVDYATQKRTLKRSGQLYGEICAANAITEDMVERYAPQVRDQVFGPRVA